MRTVFPNKISPAKLLELVSKEHVGEEDLADHVGKVEKLASKELEEIGSSLGLLLVEVPAGDKLSSTCLYSNNLQSMNSL